MNSLENYIVSLEKLHNNFIPIVNEIVNDDNYVLNRYKARMSKSGPLRSLGDYAESTIIRKRQKGQRTSPINLKDTGKFYDGMFLTFDKRQGFFVYSHEQNHTPKLVEKYGISIFDMSDREKIDIWNDFVRKALIDTYLPQGGIDLNIG